MSDLYLDLMNFAASHLEPEGRLVFWMPVVREDYKVRSAISPVAEYIGETVNFFS